LIAAAGRSAAPRALVVKVVERALNCPDALKSWALGQVEAELPWRLKDACRESDNVPEWKTLFVQGVGNHLMAYNSYKPLERGGAARGVRQRPRQ